MPKRAPLEVAERDLQAIAALVDSRVPEGWGFGLFLFSLDDAGYATWASNCNRKDAIASIRAWLATEPELRKQDDTDDPVMEVIHPRIKYALKKWNEDPIANGALLKSAIANHGLDH